MHLTLHQPQSTREQLSVRKEKSAPESVPPGAQAWASGRPAGVDNNIPEDPPRRARAAFPHPRAIFPITTDPVRKMRPPPDRRPAAARALSAALKAPFFRPSFVASRKKGAGVWGQRLPTRRVSESAKSLAQTLELKMWTRCETPKRRKGPTR